MLLLIKLVAFQGDVCRQVSLSNNNNNERISARISSLCPSARELVRLLIAICLASGTGAGLIDCLVVLRKQMIAVLF